MKWKMPQSDEAWAEWLSAYLDGELEADERRALEGWLQGEPRRVRQLDELRRVSGALAAWSIEAPDPDPEFLARLREIERQAVVARANLIHNSSEKARWAFETASRNASGWREELRRFLTLPWPGVAAIFLAGVLAGVGGVRLAQRAAAPKLWPAEPRAVAMNVHLEAPTPAISDGQADVLLREARAGNLRDLVLRDLDAGNYQAALGRYRTLRESFPGSTALQALNQNKRLQTMMEKFQAAGRI